MADNMIMFPVIETVKIAWRKVKGVKATFWAILIIVMVLQAMLGYLNKAVDAGEMGFFAIVLSIIATVIQLLLSWGLIYMGIQRALDLPVEYRMVKYAMNLSLFLRMIALYVIQALILIIPCILMILPDAISNPADSSTSNAIKLLDAGCYLVSIVLFVIFIFLIMRLYLAKGFVIANNLGPWAAIKKSFATTKGNVWRLLGLTLLNLAIVAISAIPFGIGLIWSLPYMFINYGEVYRKFTTNSL